MISCDIKKLGRHIINSFYHQSVSVPRLMIEVTDKCNLACPFCSNKDIQRKKHDIPDNIFYKAVDQYVKMGGKVLRPYSTGEPLMCKKFLEFITYARKKGLEVRFTSNGQLLTKQTSGRLIELGVQNINISAEGLDALQYESARIGGSFDRLRENLSTFLKIRDDMGLERPLLRIQTVLLEHQQNEVYVNKFKETWKDLCDSVLFGLRGTQGGNYDNNSCVIPASDRTICGFFFNLLCVNNDGTVSCCCVDYHRSLIVGDIKKQNLQDIWQGQRLRHFREMAKKKDYEKIAQTCAMCSSVSRSFIKESKEINRKSHFF